MNVAKRVLRWWRDLREDGRIYRRHCARTGSDGYAIYVEACKTGHMTRADIFEAMSHEKLALEAQIAKNQERLRRFRGTAKPTNSINVLDADLIAEVAPVELEARELGRWLEGVR